ncbi:hypothetical protein QN379_18055 [Glaciimonas sp. Gout2]|uniref:hypothetical protein n=1 Tax=unclassified Glaciimonas TaxID=2644401 RepID=UPI002B23882E|nr:MULTISPECIES: hypothetical protein [unclassified Glaciimonas]MEB0012565.1 hypothetical protein [Glaciimonas sp. Cout2]MEB0083916.1 hypothetical protein [Glaciimonas sp. Gout2]
MELIVKILVGVLLMGSMATVIVSQRASLITVKEQATRAEQGRDERDRIIATLQAADVKQRQATIKLQAARASMAVTLSERETLIEQLHHDLSIRPWAVTPLPDAIARLRKRGSLTGADAYRQWLSASHPLPVTSNGTDH